jgi:PAS domain S-box-containing protein
MENSSVEFKRPSILVVDDQPHNILLIREYLESLGVEIDEANSGIKCLEMQQKKLYTMLILDIQMPGMDGFEVLANMRKDERLKDIPVVFISAIYDSDKYVLKGIEGGAIDFIVKPVNISILRTKVSNFLKLYEKQAKLDQLVNKLETTNSLLQVSEKKIKKITNSASDSIILLDANYKISFWNKASRAIFGYVRFEITTEDFFDKLIAPDSHEILRDYFKSLLQSTTSKSINTIRITGINKAGIEFPIELSLSYFTAANNAIYYTVIIRDITRRVLMEKEALKAKELLESNRLMKDFMDNVSHELRTPMNAILGISNMLLKYNSENLNPKQVEGLQIINQSGARLLDLINDVLDLSKLENNKEIIDKEKFDLEKQLAILRSMVHSLIGTKKIKFHINKSSNVPEFVYTDLKKLNQVLINLLGNAVKFTHQGKINLFIHLIDDRLHFEISDTGVGIAEENLSLIFERFRQIDNSASKEYKGTGLGLHISRKLVELMGGKIYAESKLGNGTTLRFYIQLDKTEIHKLADVGPKKESPEFPTPQSSVSKYELPLAIVIEDNEENNYWYSNLLKENGYETISCFNSSVAFKTITKTVPDLIVLKYEMPKIHGHFLLNQVGQSKTLRQIPIIIATSEQNLSLKTINNPIILLHEPINEKQFIQHIKTIQGKPINRYELKEVILFEKEDHLKNYFEEAEDCLATQTDETVHLLLARHKISKLILDGLDKDGENIKIITWLKGHENYLPEKILTIFTEPLSEIFLNELKELPNSEVRSLESIIKMKSPGNVIH